MKFNGKEISEEIIEKATKCKTTDELLALAKTEGIEMTKDEAEAYLSETGDVELTDAELKQAAGGICWNNKACIAEEPCPMF